MYGAGVPCRSIRSVPQNDPRTRYHPLRNPTILPRAILRRTAPRKPAIPASGMRAPADSPLRVRVKASCRDMSSFENLLRPRSPVGSPPEPADTLRQLARGTHMVRGEEASTFFRLTWSCLICGKVRKSENRGRDRRFTSWQARVHYGLQLCSLEHQKERGRRSTLYLSVFRHHIQVFFLNFAGRGGQIRRLPLNSW